MTCSMPVAGEGVSLATGCRGTVSDMPSYDGMVAVGAVVMNRVNSPSFPNSISEVIYQGGQFTPASSGALASALANGVPSACYDAAVAAIGGENPIGSALYFNTGSGKGTKLGDHQFY